MIQVKKFVFNAFQVNTYILSDDTKDCVIIDPGCADGVESLELKNYIEHNGLKPVKLLLTHTHIDHVIGCQAIEEMFGLKPVLHEAGMVFLDHSTETAATYGLPMETNPEPGSFLQEGEEVAFGNSSLKVLYTPGHADGSVCFLSENDGFVIVGDVLFQMSIGRTDFPTGDFDLLKSSIYNKLFTLPEDTIVYSGHGPETTVGFEKMNNPFLGDDNIIH